MQEQISLDKRKKGEIVSVHSYSDSSLPAKFYELGFTPGSLIQIKHKAPLNGPICVNIIENDTLIAVRITEAKLILTNKV